ncbi:MAG TPA: DUF819 family protein [Bacteroidales bacterium]|nr:DUF819 family protein [Bacteroidales bacterium]
MIKIILLIAFYVLFPLLIIFICKKWSFFRKIGTIVLAYGFGLVLGSSGIFPEGSTQYKIALQGRSAIPSAEMQTLVAGGKLPQDDVFVNQIATVQDLIPSVAVPLAFPLLLFSLNLKRWLRFAKKGFISVILALVAGVVMVTLGFFIWKDSIPESWKLAGMFEGIYAGGTPNFVAIKMALNVDPNLFIIVSTYDVVVGAFLVLFFITVAPKFFRLILPAYKYEKNVAFSDDEIKKETDDLEDFSGFFSKGRLLPLAGALGLSFVIVAIGLGLTFLFPKVPMMVVVILSITTLGILASFIPKVNRIEKTFQLGMYLILVFSLTVASMANIKSMFGVGMLSLIMFITWCYFGSMLFHLLLAKIFRIDADNFLITSAAFVFSPPFVPLVANALKNRELIVTGITGGILGYVLGNYMGVALAYFLKGF